MAEWKEFKEHAIRSGLGTALCYQLPDETKYHILSAVDTLPAVFGSPETIEYSTTTNMTVTNIEGKKKTENIEISVPYNQDNIALCTKIAGIKCKYAYIDLEDFSGQEFIAKASYHMGEVGADTVKMIVINLTVYDAEETITNDLFDEYMDTITFEDTLPAIVRISGKGKKEFVVTTSPTTATVNPSPKTSAEGVVTATYGGNKLTITGVSNGSCTVTVSATLEGYASNQRIIKCIVTGNAE